MKPLWVCLLKYTPSPDSTLRLSHLFTHPPFTWASAPRASAHGPPPVWPRSRPPPAHQPPPAGRPRGPVKRTTRVQVMWSEFTQSRTKRSEPRTNTSCQKHLGLLKRSNVHLRPSSQKSDWPPPTPQHRNTGTFTWEEGPRKAHCRHISPQRATSRATSAESAGSVCPAPLAF